jgi:Tfp pilus assembly protein PilN
MAAKITELEQTIAQLSDELAAQKQRQAEATQAQATQNRVQQAQMDQALRRSRQSPNPGSQIPPGFWERRYLRRWYR